MLFQESQINEWLKYETMEEFNSISSKSDGRTMGNGSCLQSLWNACTGCDEAQMKNPDLTRTVYKTEIPDQVEDIKTSAWYPYGGIDRLAEELYHVYTTKVKKNMLNLSIPIDDFVEPMGLEEEP